MMKQGVNELLQLSAPNYGVDANSIANLLQVQGNALQQGASGLGTLGQGIDSLDKAIDNSNFADDYSALTKSTGTVYEDDPVNRMTIENNKVPFYQQPLEQQQQQIQQLGIGRRLNEANQKTVDKTSASRFMMNKNGTILDKVTGAIKQADGQAKEIERTGYVKQAYNYADPAGKQAIKQAQALDPHFTPVPVWDGTTNKDGQKNYSKTNMTYQFNGKSNLSLADLTREVGAMTAKQQGRGDLMQLIEGTKTTDYKAEALKGEETNPVEQLVKKKAPRRDPTIPLAKDVNKEGTKGVVNSLLGTNLKPDSETSLTESQNKDIATQVNEDYEQMIAEKLDEKRAKSYAYHKKQYEQTGNIANKKAMDGLAREAGITPKLGPTTPEQLFGTKQKQPEVKETYTPPEESLTTKLLNGLKTAFPNTTKALKGKQAQASGLPDEQYNRLVELESSGKVDAKNPNSSAYGLYQFMTEPDKKGRDSTGFQYAKKLGYKGKQGEELRRWMNKERQDKMFQMFTGDNLSSLKDSGMEPTLFNIYGSHQQGATGFKEIMSDKKKLSKERYRNIRNNIPNYGQGLTDEEARQTWIKLWKSKTA